MYMVPRRSVSSPAAASGTGETPGQNSTRGRCQRRLAGRVMVVTGASRGIGAAVARRFAADGARVFVTYYPSQQMRELAHAVVEDILGGGGRAHAVALDVANPASVAEAFRIVREQAGPVDVLVNNAAQTLRKPWEEIELPEWDAVMDVNVRGALLCCQATYTDMAARQRGVYIMVGSVEVALGRAGGLAYVTSKAALVGFTRSLAREAGRRTSGRTSSCSGPCEPKQKPSSIPTAARPVSGWPAAKACRGASPPMTSPGRSPSSPATTAPTSQARSSM